MVDLVDVRRHAKHARLPPAQAPVSQASIRAQLSKRLSPTIGVSSPPTDWSSAFMAISSSLERSSTTSCRATYSDDLPLSRTRRARIGPRRRGSASSSATLDAGYHTAILKSSRLVRVLEIDVSQLSIPRSLRHITTSLSQSP